MKKKLFFFLLISLIAFAGQSKEKTDKDFPPQQNSIGFLENKGQITDDKHNSAPYILFKSTLPGLDIYITTSGFTYVFLKGTVPPLLRERGIQFVTPAQTSFSKTRL